MEFADCHRFANLWSRFLTKLFQWFPNGVWFLVTIMVKLHADNISNFISHGRHQQPAAICHQTLLLMFSQRLLLTVFQLCTYFPGCWQQQYRGTDVAQCFQPNYSPGTGDYPGLLIITPAHCRVIKTFIRHQTSDIIPGAGRPCRVLSAGTCAGC